MNGQEEEGESWVLLGKLGRPVWVMVVGGWLAGWNGLFKRRGGHIV